MTNKIMHYENFMHSVVDPRASSDISGYPIVPARISEKQLVIVIKETQQDEDSFFGRTIRKLKTTQKHSSKVRILAHRRRFPQANWERSLECERESYRPYSFSYQEPPQAFVDEYGWIPLPAWGYVTLETTQEDIPVVGTSEEPDQEFAPSNLLTELVIQYMVQPDEDVLALIEEIKKVHPESEDERQNVSNLITEQIEGLMTNLAQRIFFTGKPIQILNDNMFSNDICLELIERMGLEVFHSPQVLKLLYSEFVDFVSECPRERKWGKIIFENSEIKLILEDDAFTLPDPDKIEKDKKWIAT